jgi:DNA relaxase NicK
MKPLSEHLAELSVSTKKAEERVAQAQAQASDRIEQQREQVRMEAEQALAQVKQRVGEIKDDARTHRNALQAKIDTDFNNMKQRATERREKFESWQANNYADDKEADALAAIDYAIASTKLAELQALDAIAARAEAVTRAEQTQAPQPTLA